MIEITLEDIRLNALETYDDNDLISEYKVLSEELDEKIKQFNDYTAKGDNIKRTKTMVVIAVLKDRSGKIFDELIKRVPMLPGANLNNLN